MGDTDKATQFPFTFGCDPRVICEECRLPCRLERMSIDCHRRVFLQGMLNCVYFIQGYCFLIDHPGCVFDNSGSHDTYWLHLLGEFFHNVNGREEDEEYLRNRAEVLKLVERQIENKDVFLCRYLEEYYTQILASGGGLSEDMLSKLDEAYLSILRGISRKTD